MDKEQLKELRARTKMSRREFREIFGVPQRTIQDWEEGKSKPPEYVFKLLSKAVDDYCKTMDNDSEKNKAESRMTTANE